MTSPHFELGRAIGALKIALPYIEKIAATQPTERARKEQQQQAERDAKLIREIIAEIEVA